MADFASQILGIASQTAQNQPDLAGAVQKGADLAQHVQNIQTQRAQIEQQKQEMQMQKIGKVASLYEVAGKSEGKHQKFMYEQAIPNTIKALGLEDYFPESTQAFFQSAPMAMPYIKSRLNDPGEDSQGFMAKIMTAAQDPTGEELGKLMPEIQRFGALEEIAKEVRESGDDLLKSQQFGLEAARKREAAQLAADAAAGRQASGQNFTASQSDKTNAEAYGKKLVELGIPGMETTLKKINTKVIPGGFDKYDGKSQIEGIGGSDSLIPIGRLGAKGRANRQIFQDLANDYIKMQTGAGVGVDEAIRLAGSLGFDMAVGEGGGIKAIFKGTKSSADMVAGVKNLRDKMNEVKTTLQAGAGPGAIQYFERNKALFSGETLPGKPVSSGAKTKAGVDAANEAPKKSWRDYDETSQQTLINNWMKSTGKSKEEVIKMLDQRARGEL